MKDLINFQASTAYLFFNKSPTEMEKFLSPVHCKHVFNVMLKQVGPQRPEMKILGEFCCLTRRTYLHAKLVKIRI